MTPEGEADEFYSGAERRAARFLLALGILTTAILFTVSRAAAVGFGVGTAAAYLNFVSLKRFAAAFSAQAASPDAKGSGGGIVLNYLFRFGLLALAAYAIFRSSRAAALAFVAALLLPVAALAIEAFYEAYVALRRGL